MPKSRYKTSFPVARIKKIMQLDEDVGKVAQATPILISKALEMFLQTMLDEACAEVRSREGRRVLPQDIKHLIETTEKYDFLRTMTALQNVQGAPVEPKLGRKLGSSNEEPKRPRTKSEKAEKVQKAENMEVKQEPEEPPRKVLKTDHVDTPLVVNPAKSPAETSEKKSEAEEKMSVASLLS